MSYLSIQVKSPIICTKEPLHGGEMVDPELASMVDSQMQG